MKVTENILEDIYGMRMITFATYMNAKIKKGHSVKYASKMTEIHFKDFDRHLKEKYLNNISVTASRLVKNSIYFKVRKF